MRMMKNYSSEQDGIRNGVCIGSKVFIVTVVLFALLVICIVIIVVGILVIVIDLYSNNGSHYATLMASPGSEMNNSS